MDSLLANHLLNTSLYWKCLKRLPENPEYAEMRHGDVILRLQRSHRSACNQHAAVCFLSFPSAVWGM